MKDSTILLRAKARYETIMRSCLAHKWHGRSNLTSVRYEGLCNYIREAGREVGQRVLAESLVLWVESMLGDDAYLEAWLRKQHGIYTGDDFNESRVQAQETAEKIVATRLAWLDWMIAECVKQEKAHEHQ